MRKIFFTKSPDNFLNENNKFHICLSAHIRRFRHKSIRFQQGLTSKYALLLFSSTRPQESLLSLLGGGPFSSSSDPSLDGDGELALAMRFRLLFQISSMVLSTPNMCKKLPINSLVPSSILSIFS